MKLNYHTARALLQIAAHSEAGRAWPPYWAEKSVKKLLDAGYVEKRHPTTRLDFCIWITDAGRAALREHQEGRG